MEENFKRREKGGEEMTEESISLVQRQRHLKVLLFLFITCFFFLYPGVTFAGTGHTIAGPEFTNDQDWIQEETGGNNVSDVIGVSSDHTLDLFSNPSPWQIRAAGTVGDVSGSGADIHAISGVFVGGGVNETFTNSGTISAEATIGDVSSSSSAQINSIYGVFVGGGVNETFNNSGTISASAKMGDVSSSSSAQINSIYGVFVGVGDVTTFTNSGTISASAKMGDVSSSSSAQINSIYGVFVGGGDVTDTFTNSGTISAVAIMGNVDGSSAQINSIYGVFVSGDVTYTFNNSGTISASATMGNVSGSTASINSIYGVFVGDVVGGFINSDRISASATMGNVTGSNNQIGGIAGVNIANSVEGFHNLDTISATATMGDVTGSNNWIGEIAGVYINDSVFGFSNSGTIYATAEMGSVVGDDNVIEGVVGANILVDVEYEFTNSGTISASATMGSVSSSSNTGITDIFGVYVGGDVRSFDNSGTISASATMGSVDGSDAEIEYILGVYVDGATDTFTNTGTISATATMGNVSSNSAAQINGMSGVYVDDNVTTFTNSGTISATATMGDVSSSPSAGIAEILGVLVDGDVTNFTNTGTISASVSVGSMSGSSSVNIEDIYGVRLRNSTNPSSFNNTGNILVSINAPSQATVSNIAGIMIDNSNDVTLSNPGTVQISITGPDPSNISNVRTLWIESSTVTLNDKFSIVFGSPGIDPSPDSSTNIDKRPIYVSSLSTLNLNNTDLVARSDSRNLKFDKKYYLIHNEGTVDGTFGGLIKGYPNPEVTVNWAGEDKAENSAVIFGYVTGKQSLTTAMGPTASYIISSSLANTILGFSYEGLPVYALGKNNERLLFASTAMVPVSLPKQESRYGLFVMPVYTRVNANDLGFDADAYGFALGATGRILDNLVGTIYGGYSRVDLDYKVRGPRNEDQDIYLAGFTLGYTSKPYFAKLNTNFHWTDHDYRGLTGLNYELAEKAKYHSWGFDGELTGGYAFELGRLSLAPEMGIGYTYYKGDDFTTKVGGYPAWNRNYKLDSVDFVKGILGLSGVVKLGQEQSKSVLYGSIRVEQAFEGNDVSVISYLQGLPQYRLKKDISNTTVVGQMGVSTRLSDRWILDISGRTDLNANYKAYSGKAYLRYTF